MAHVMGQVIKVWHKQTGMAKSSFLIIWQTQGEDVLYINTKMCMRGLEILFSDQKVSFQNSKPIMGVHRHVCLDLFVCYFSFKGCCNAICR